MASNRGLESERSLKPTSNSELIECCSTNLCIRSKWCTAWLGSTSKVAVSSGLLAVKARSLGEQLGLSQRGAILAGP